MTDGEVAAAMEVARAGEAARVRALPERGVGHDALRHGIEVIYHANYADERALDALEAARDRVLRRARARPHLQPEPGRRPVGDPARAGARLRARAGGLRRGGRPHAQARHPRAARRRLRLRLVTPHGTYARDLWLFVKILGFSPMETLVAATRLGGELMGRPGELGVVKAGALADLLLVDGDPLADIAILQDRSALRMIMKDGALHKLA